VTVVTVNATVYTWFISYTEATQKTPTKTVERCSEPVVHIGYKPTV